MLDDPIDVSKEEDLKSLKKCQKIRFTCRNCGTTVERLYMYSRLETIKRFLCKKCNSETTCLKKFGYKNAAQNPEIKKKFQETNIRKYGNICSLNGPEQVEKKIETWKNNFGKTNPFQKDSSREAAKQTCLKHYGVEYAFSSDEVRKRIYQTRIENGTLLRVCKWVYIKDDITFDSSWELAFYIFCTDLGLKVERNKTILRFTTEDGKEHVTYVDFLVEGIVNVEIKSTYLLKMESPEKIAARVENKVFTITDMEIKPYLKYVEDKYGIDYLKSFRKK